MDQNEMWPFQNIIYSSGSFTQISNLAIVYVTNFQTARKFAKNSRKWQSFILSVFFFLFNIEDFKLKKSPLSIFMKWMFLSQTDCQNSYWTREISVLEESNFESELSEKFQILLVQIQLYFKPNIIHIAKEKILHMWAFF